MGLFGRKFPYTNFHELNLDWLVDTVLTLKENLVLSVNGQTGEIVLYQNPDVVFPAIDQASWRIVRTAAGNNLGVHFQNGLMYVLDGNTLDRVYTLNHPPEYPVISVNGQTGSVTLYPEAGVRLPDVSDNYMNIRRQIDSAGTPEIVGLQVDKTNAERIAGTQRIKIYDEQNTPPYPVTSVNGQTGAVMLAIPFDTPLSASIWNATTASSDHNTGFARDTIDGTISVIFTSEATKAEAYIQFISADQQTEYVKKLLTTDDIPSSSGVVSINGLTGVVTLNGDNVPTSAQDNTALSTTIANIQTILTAQANTITARTAELKAAENSVSYVVDGKQSAVVIPAGAYFLLVNSEIPGRSDGLYTASQTIPATTDINNTYFTELTPISGGGLNALNSNLSNIGTIVTAITKNVVSCPNGGATTQIGSFVLSKGVWIIILYGWSPLGITAEDATTVQTGYPLTISTINTRILNLVTYAEIINDNQTIPVNVTNWESAAITSDTQYSLLAIRIK